VEWCSRPSTAILPSSVPHPFSQPCELSTVSSSHALPERMASERWLECSQFEKIGGIVIIGTVDVNDAADALGRVSTSVALQFSGAGIDNRCGAITAYSFPRDSLVAYCVRAFSATSKSSAMRPRHAPRQAQNRLRWWVKRVYTVKVQFTLQGLLLHPAVGCAMPGRPLQIADGIVQNGSSSSSRCVLWPTTSRAGCWS
jgi:hypothetical protein